MGRWRQQTDLYGEVEQWVPDFRGEWPADDMAVHGIVEGVVPNPCPTCSGELTRRFKFPDAPILERERIRREKMTAAAKAKGHEAPIFPEMVAPLTQRLYSVACYRRPHGYEKSGTHGKTSPTAIGKVLELVPAGRTGDWSDR